LRHAREDLPNVGEAMREQRLRNLTYQLAPMRDYQHAVIWI
jgi:hypothetical protein